MTEIERTILWCCLSWVGLALIALTVWAVWPVPLSNDDDFFERAAVLHEHLQEMNDRLVSACERRNCPEMDTADPWTEPPYWITDYNNLLSRDRGLVWATIRRLSASSEMMGDEFNHAQSVAPQRAQCHTECEPHLAHLTDRGHCWCQYPVDLGHIEFDWRLAGDLPAAYAGEE